MLWFQGLMAKKVGVEEVYGIRLLENVASINALSISGKNLTDIINVIYSCHVGFAMICTECERNHL